VMDSQRMTSGKTRFQTSNPANNFAKVNPRGLAENAAVMTVVAYALADSAERAPR
jgi:hypothetical protein